jgi:hypothetical protein
LAVETDDLLGGDYARVTTIKYTPKPITIIPPPILRGKRIRLVPGHRPRPFVRTKTPTRTNAVARTAATGPRLTPARSDTSTAFHAPSVQKPTADAAFSENRFFSRIRTRLATHLVINAVFAGARVLQN